MAKITISDLQTAGALTGAEKIAVVQSGFTKQTDLAGLPVSTATQTALNLKANQTSVDILDDFRVWDSGRAYSINDPAFYLGIPYRAKTANTNKTPSTNPSDWEVVGGGGAQIGNIAPDPAGSKGNAGWTGTVSTIANGLTGFATELQITADSIQTIPIPTQLQGEALEIRFEAVVSSGTGITAKVYSDSGATVEIPMSSTGINATGKTAFVGSFWAVGANVYLKIAGTSFNLRATNFYIGRPETVQGAVKSPRLAWTPQLSTGALGTVTENVATKHRDGENLVLEWRLKQTGGTIGSGTYLILLPDNNTVDLVRKPIGSVVGYCKISQAAAELVAPTRVGVIVIHDATQIKVQFYAGATDLFSDWGSGAFGLNTTVNLSFTASIPCAQFTSSMTIVGMNEPFFLSNSESAVNTNGVAAKTQIGTWAPILANTAATYYDLQLPRPLMLGEKPKIILRSKVDGNSIPVELASVPSLYVGSLRQTFLNSTNNLFNYGFYLAKISSNVLRVYMSSTTTGGASALEGTSGVARSWDQIRTAADGYDAWMVEISRGGEAWAVPPVVYGEATATNFVNGRIQFGTVVEDTNGGWTTGASARYTVKVNGLYSINGIRPSPGVGGTLSIYKNGSLFSAFVSPSSAGISVSAERKMRLVAGDYIEFYGNNTATEEVRAQITRIGS